MSINYRITQSRLLYVLTINDRKHANLLKVGEVFVDNNVADNPDKQVLCNAVRDILDKRPYMKGITYHLEHVECTTYNQQTRCYKADDVYRTLCSMDVPCSYLDNYKGEKADIWFSCTINKVLEAIGRIKNGFRVEANQDIKFRPEQEKAIKETVAHFQKVKGKAFLWNAKMRFGKTLCGLEVAKRMEYKSTLIITHRPVVDKGWGEDFDKIFSYPSPQGVPNYYYATRMDIDINQNDTKPNHVHNITLSQFNSFCEAVDTIDKRLVMFVSMQYLRSSQFVGGKERNFNPLKKAIMEYDWDFVMVDEAHEGIEAAAGVRVMDKLKKENTRILSLSGTPFNLLDKYDEGEIYTWDYVMEQRAKQEWDDKHFGDPNPYADLPRMQILTFTLPKMLRDQAIENNESFKFHEFFRVWTEDDIKDYQKLIDKETDQHKREDLQAQQAGIEVGKFVHEGAVRRFLDKLVEESNTSQYPFSTEEFREYFRHTFWILPGVKEAAALHELLKKHDVFGENNGMFHIINAAGDGNIEDKEGSALADVMNNIRGNAAKNITKKDYTITLSCGKLTTGVSVPEWTAVLCMKGSENTPAANYMQTIFRVQTHAVLNGRQKSDCYVFDFAPDRALTAVAETAKMAVDAQGAGKKQMKRKQKEEEEHLQAFIKLCPVLSMDEGEMGKHFSANQIFEKLSNVYIERAVRSGYADNSIYNPDQLLNLTPEQEKALGDVHDLLGSMPAGWKPEKININKNGLGDTEGAEMIKYIYYLTSQNVIPPRPVMSAESDDNGCPMTDTEGWDDKMCAPTQIFPYLFVSNSRFIEGQWTDFSKPVLWKEWSDTEKDTDEAKKKREQENKEKRARMSVLRGVAIRIPLLVYGAEINDEDGEEITIDNFASEKIVDQPSWEEFMPKGFTKETFNILKDCFDRSIFTGAAKRIRQMVKEADNLNTEDRIAKIATIFSYFHNPDKETVLTPWKVVNRHLSECIGGWCFFNEEFDDDYTEQNEYGENIKMARPVGMKNDENKQIVFTNKATKDIFGDYNARILEINSKTGLYPLYMAYSLFKTSKEKAFRESELTGERGTSTDSEGYYRQASNDLEIWKDVLQDNIFVICRTKMAVSITKRTLAGFRNDISMNVKCYEKEIAVDDLINAGVIRKDAEGITKEDHTYRYNGASLIECDMINVLRAKPNLFMQEVVKGIDYWHVYNSIPKSSKEDINNMKFKAIVGNPPYQEQIDSSRSLAKQHFPIFIETGIKMNPDYLSLITPARWFTADAQDNSFPKLRSFVKKNNHFSIISSYNGKTLFPSTDLSTVSTFLWDKNYQGDVCFIEHFGENSTLCRPLFEKNLDIILPSNNIVSILKKILLNNHIPLNSITTGRDAFGIVGKGFAERSSELYFDGAVSVQCAYEEIRYYDKTLIQKNVNILNSYKVFTSKGNGGAGLLTDGKPVAIIGKAFIAGPNTACTDSLIPFGCFDDKYQAINLQKYFTTKFLRFLVGVLKVSQNLYQNVYEFVPMQDFSNSSDIDWKKKVEEIDQQLYKKYNLNTTEIAYIEGIIKPME